MDEYSKFLILEKDQLKERFIKDLKAWEDAAEVAEKKKAAYNEKMKRFMIDQQKLFFSYFP